MQNSKKVLITGASGFIGTNLIESLLDLNFEIAIMDRSSKKNRFSNKYQIIQYTGDITDYSFVEESVLEFEPDTIFHLAAYKERSAKVEDVVTSLNVNLLGTLNLYQALLKVSTVQSVITLGTMDEYGEIDTPYNESLTEKPVSAYGFSKFCATKLSEFFYRNFDLPVTVLRPTIAYGPTQGQEMFIPSLISTLISDEQYLMTPGDQNRDFIYIKDLISAMLYFSKCKKSAGQIFNIGSGKSIKIKDVALLVARLLGKEHLVQVGSREYRLREIMNYSTSIEKTQKAIDWEPKTSFEEGILSTIQHYQKN